MKLKKAVAVLITMPLWLPILTYLLFQALIANTKNIKEI